MTIPNSSAERPKLLIVDDQAINIAALNEIFKNDHEIVTASSGEEALSFCEQSLPDIILLDVIMPHIDGHEVCRRLKADSRTSGIPIIFITAQNAPDEEALGLQLGAVDFITRPMNAAVVRARVRTHLQLRKALAEVSELNENLEKKVAERSAALEAAMEQLHQSQEELSRSESKATISTLLASVSHELNSPIGNSVLTASTLADQAVEFIQLVEAGTIKRAHLTEFITTLNEGTSLILRNLKRAEELLKDIRQVVTDQASEQRRQFDLATTIQEIIHTLTPSLKRYPHQLVLEIPEGINMDSQPGSVGQIVINLINNAYLHAFENRTDGTLTIKASQQDDSVNLSFCDNGIGIPEENLGKLFEPYFSTKIGKGGTGLGMAIVKNLVTKNLGGTIAVQSSLGQGSCFNISLPLHMPEADNSSE